jgi:hypothetical protein
MPMTRATITPLVFISVTCVVPSVAGAQDAPQDKPDEKTQERPTGLPCRITWTFNFDAERINQLLPYQVNRVATLGD